MIGLRLLIMLSLAVSYGLSFRVPIKINPSRGFKSSITTLSSAASSLRTADTVKIKNLKKFEDSLEGRDLTLKGWVRTVRKQKTLTFVELNDGSSLSSCQVVCDHASLPEDVVKEAQSLQTGASISVVGALKESSGSKQKYDFQLSSMSLLGACPPEEYPLAKKRHSLEYLRTLAHIRPRTNTVAAVARVRSKLAQSIHRFFEGEEFFLVNTPVVTASDCEGAGEMFRVTTLDLDDVSSVPTKKDGEASGKGADYGEDFFGKPAYLTVSGQLAAETYACAMGDVYTFGPTFRAENSQTARHLAEFHMIEPEMAFAELDDAMDNAERFVQYVVRATLSRCASDLTFFDKFYDKTLLARLNELADSPFARVSYREAVELLQAEIAKDPTQWQFPDVEFGTDLATEHERWLAEKHFGKATFVYNYPAAIKAFYMRGNDADDGETVAAMDLLVPGVGELIGGSQREERLDVLTAKMDKLGLAQEDYWWYLDLRRYGSVPHSGYGLGFERLVCYVTGIENIRDAIAFPRYPGNAEF